MISKLWCSMPGLTAAWVRLVRTTFDFRRKPPVATTFLNPGDILSNPGLCRLNASAADLEYKTVIVIGINRGGTSMAAAALHALGIEMGEAQAPLYEDQPLNKLIDTRDRTGAAQIVAERDRKHAVWGFKHPSGAMLSSSWRRIFREPVYVVVFRDPLAVANRRAVSREKDLFREISVALNQYTAILSALRRCGRPALLVSYEKALLRPDDFAGQFAAFLGLEDAERIAAAGRLIRPSPDAYRSVARHRSAWSGYLDIVQPNHVAGWAFRTGVAEPATVCLSVNGAVATHVIADLPRPDVQQQFAHLTASCGFAVDLPVQSGDIVSATLQDIPEDLNNSPQRCP